MPMTLDRDQGLDKHDRRFGYVEGEDGGWFFTHMGTLDETLNSLEANEIDGDGGLTEAEVMGEECPVDSPWVRRVQAVAIKKGVQATADECCDLINSFRNLVETDGEALTVPQICEQFSRAGKIEGDYTVVLFRNEAEERHWLEECQQNDYDGRTAKTEDFIDNPTSQYVCFAPNGDRITVEIES